jgi:hypothetical protein
MPPAHEFEPLASSPAPEFAVFENKIRRAQRKDFSSLD